MSFQPCGVWLAQEKPEGKPPPGRKRVKKLGFRCCVICISTSYVTIKMSIRSHLRLATTFLANICCNCVLLQCSSVESQCSPLPPSRDKVQFLTLRNAQPRVHGSLHSAQCTGWLLFKCSPAHCLKSPCIYVIGWCAGGPGVP